MKEKLFKAAMGVGLSALMLCSAATGCSGKSGGEVPVQSISSIINAGAIGMVDRFSGVVVSGNTTNIELDSSMTVAEIRVEVGQEVNQGDILFTYDTEAMQLNIEQAELEIQSLKNTISTDKTQKAQLEKDKKNASKSDQLSYTLEIQSLETQIRETEYNISLKQKDLNRQKENLKDADVKSPVSGNVTAINKDGGYDQNTGNALPYMVITDTTNLRIKGTINELSRDSIMEGSEVTIRSRTDADTTWSGTVEKIDWDNQVQNNNNYYYGSSDEMTSSSKYPFYVTIYNADGLFLGQHVYIEPGITETDDGTDLLWLPSYFINDLDSDAPWVWASDAKDKIEKRYVTLGEMNDMTGEYVISSGLTTEDYIALPSDTINEGMKVSVVDDVFAAQADSYSEEDGYYGDDTYEGEDYSDFEYTGEDGNNVEGEYAEGQEGTEYVDDDSWIIDESLGNGNPDDDAVAPEVTHTENSTGAEG